MGETDETVELVHRSLSSDAATAFDERLENQAEWLRAAIDDGRMDNDDFTVGLEMEAYAIDPAASVPRLARLPDEAFRDPGTNKELGLHNVEINTEPTVLSEEGLAAQAAEIRERTAIARGAVEDHDRELVLDAMWTVPPAEGAAAYLCDTEERNGVVLASNMRQDPRYVAIDNATLEHAGGDGIGLDVPGVERTFPSILFESLATSIQPHVQVPEATAFPGYYNAAIRTLGPLLALSTNSPFLPSDFYGEVTDPDALIAETHHELRIAVFEQSVNASPNPKVRVPRDIETTAETVDRVVADDRYAPFLREWIEGDTSRDTLADRIWEFDHKRGTYWRWLRCVVGGDHVDAHNDEHSLRIEYRPLPTQPTVTDVVGLQTLTAGLIRGLVEADHPISTLPWEAARSSFYSAARSGLDADLAWVTAEGERTSDPDVIFGEVFDYARRGLEVSGVPAAEAREYLAPIEARWDAGLTPSMWKKARVREFLGAGADLETALAKMQATYVDRARETDSFADWL